MISPPEDSKTSLNDLGQVVGFPLHEWRPPERPSREPLRGRYCRLERLDPDRHAADLFDAFTASDGEYNWGYLPYGPFENVAGLREWMNAECMGEDPMFHAIIDNESAMAVGVASYLRINPDSGSIEVGHIHYSPLLQKKPAATEAMYLMMKQVFELGYRRYEWKCNSLNRPSRDAAMRYGFSYEGVFRQMQIVKGCNRDTAWYACIDSEWPALQKAYESWLAPDNFDADGRQITRLSELTRPILVKTGC